MAYKITEECISCGACEGECPNKAISEGASTYQIAPDKCTECVGAHDSSKCAEVCPVEACQLDPRIKRPKNTDGEIQETASVNSGFSLIPVQLKNKCRCEFQSKMIRNGILSFWTLVIVDICHKFALKNENESPAHSNGGGLRLA